MASRQSSVIANRDSLEAKLKSLESEYETKEISRPEFWGGFMVKPIEIEFWQGRANRLHDRIRYPITRRYSWKIERLSP